MQIHIMRFLHGFFCKTHWTDNFIRPSLLEGEKAGLKIAQVHSKIAILCYFFQIIKIIKGSTIS